MYFSELTEYLEKLDKTSSRLEMTRILAELLKKVSAREGQIVAYLSQGQLGPKFDNPDTGMGDKQILKAIRGVSGEDVGQIFKKEGDLGKTVEMIKSQGTSSKKQIGEVYEELLAIADASGAGSQEKKIRLLGDLVTGLSGKEAKYAVRMVLGKMRTGFSDMTVLDALSVMVIGDKSLRGKIEKIYNVRADLGEVVRLIKSQDTDKQQIEDIRIEPEVGTPVLPARAERAKSMGEIWERVGPEAAVEHKLDGLRIQAHVIKSQDSDSKKQTEKIKLFSRGMENVTAMYPDVVEGLRKQVDTDCILDGEMIAVGEDGKYLPFQETVQRKRKYDISEMMQQIPLKYYTFDCLVTGKKNLLKEPNEKRWEELEKIIDITPSDPPLGPSGGRDVVRLMPRKIVHTEKEIEEFFKEALKEGTEGVVVKKLNENYKSGSRDFSWIKFKKSYAASAMPDTVDAVIMGYDAGQGKRASFGIGDFLIGVYDKKKEIYRTIAKIGTGLTDEEWIKVRLLGEKLRVMKKPGEYEVTKQMECDFWMKPEVVVEILADEITKSPMHSSGLALRFPRLVSFREKKPEDTTSMTELARLFEIQRETE